MLKYRHTRECGYPEDSIFFAVALTVFRCSLASTSAFASPDADQGREYNLVVARLAFNCAELPRQQR